MKELTTKQKLDFILYCMEKIDDFQEDFFTCNELCNYFNVDEFLLGKTSTETSIELFPELEWFMNPKYGYWDDGLLYTNFSDNNSIRAIIYSFLYNHLTGEIDLNS